MADLKRDVEIILAIKDRTSDGINSALKNVERLKTELNATTKSFKNMTKAGSGQLNQSLRTAATLAKRATREVNGLGTSVKKTSNSAKGMNGQFSKFQVLVRKINSAKFAIVGIAGAFTGVARNVSGLNLEMEALRRRFAIIDNTNLAGLGNSFRFVTEEARRLGLPIRELATGFSGFILALQGTQLEGKRGVETFSRLTAAFTALGLSQVDVNGSLRALSQIASKGVVSSEELRQQLGERLPGAFSIAARSLGISTRELNKQLALGTIESADFLEKFSIEIEKTFGSQLQDAIDSPRASFARLNNEFLLLRDTLGGFVNTVLQPLADGFTDLLLVINQASRASDNLIERLLRVKAVRTAFFIFQDTLKNSTQATKLLGEAFKDFADNLEVLNSNPTAEVAVSVAAKRLNADKDALTKEFVDSTAKFNKLINEKTATYDDRDEILESIEKERESLQSLLKTQENADKTSTNLFQKLFSSVLKFNTVGTQTEETYKNVVKETIDELSNLETAILNLPDRALKEAFNIPPEVLENRDKVFSQIDARTRENVFTQKELAEQEYSILLRQLQQSFTAVDRNGQQKLIVNQEYLEQLEKLQIDHNTRIKAIDDDKTSGQDKLNKKGLADAKKSARERTRLQREEARLSEELTSLKIQAAEELARQGDTSSLVEAARLKGSLSIARAETDISIIQDNLNDAREAGNAAAETSYERQLELAKEIKNITKETADEDVKAAERRAKFEKERNTVGGALREETNQLFGAGLLDLGDFETNQDLLNAKLRETQQIIGLGINGAVDGLSGGLQGLIDGTQSFGEAFQKVGQQMLAMITRLIAQMIVLAIVRRIAGLKGGGEVTDSGFTGIGETGGSIQYSANGGLITSNSNIRSSNIALGSRNSDLFNNNLLSALNDDDMLVRTNTNGVTDVTNGGLMPGTPNKRDDKLSVAEVGQYVIPGNKVSKYGPGFFHYLDALAQSGRRIQARAIGGEIMKYANGGGVGRTEPVFLSSGEYVMSKQATQFFGTKFFERIRKGIASPDDLKLDLDSIVNGGRVPGQRNNRDDRLAVGPRDGFVIPNSKVSKFGEKFFEDINTFSLTNRRFANGGMLGKPSYNFTGGVTARMSPTVASMNPVDVNSALGDRAGGATQPDLSLTIVDDNRNERLQAVEEDRTIVSVKNARRRGELLTL